METLIEKFGRTLVPPQHAITPSATSAPAQFSGLPRFEQDFGEPEF